jgi:hypothetical protein
MSHFLSLETANKIYVWGGYIGLIGAFFALLGVWNWRLAFVGALCGFVGFSMNLAGSSIRDADSDQIRNYVIPRQLTLGEARALSNALLNREHRKTYVVFVAPDEEASQYAGQIIQALRQGGWEPRLIPTSPDAKTWFEGPFAQGLSIWDVDAVSAGTSPTSLLLQNAFRQAHIFVEGVGSARPISSFNFADNEDATVLLVGRRPLVPQQTYKRKVIKLPDGSSKLIFEPEPRL